MKEKYVVPEADVSFVDDSDVIMASPTLSVEENGTVPLVSWGELTS